MPLASNHADAFLHLLYLLVSSTQLQSAIAATEPAITSGTKGAARSRWLFPLRFAELFTG